MRETLCTLLKISNRALLQEKTHARGAHADRPLALACCLLFTFSIRVRHSHRASQLTASLHCSTHTHKLKLVCSVFCTSKCVSELARKFYAACSSVLESSRAHCFSSFHFKQRRASVSSQYIHPTAVTTCILFSRFSA